MSWAKLQRPFLHTSNDLNRSARPDEHFFVSRWRPRLWFYANLLVVRVLFWGPWPFVSYEIGWFLSSPKCRGLQLYVGIKCDGSRTEWWNGLGEHGYVMTYTLKELAAFRWKSTLDRHPVWNNQGGA